jgi:hypothetical protein
MHSVFPKQLISPGHSSFCDDGQGMEQALAAASIDMPQ